MPEDLNKLTLNDFRKDPELMFSFLDFFLGFKPYNYQLMFLQPGQTRFLAARF